MGKIIKTLNEQLTKKGVEINEFKNKHNIQVRGDGFSPMSEVVESQNEEKKTEHGGLVIVNDV